MKKKLYVIFGLFVLTLALGVTVKLSEKPQEIRRKAAENNLETSTAVEVRCDTFTPFTLSSVPDEQTYPFSLTVGDINADGLKDVCVGFSHNTSHEVVPGYQCIKNIDNKEYLVGSLLTFKRTSSYAAISVGFVGGTDFVYTPGTTLASLYIMNNTLKTGNQLLSNIVSFYEPNVTKLGPNILTTDLNNDGYQEIVSSDQDYAIQVFFNKKDGTFNTYVDYSVPYGYHFTAVADLKGDGSKDDLVVSSFQKKQISVLLNNGAGLLGAAVGYTVPSDVQFVYPYGITAADYDGDGLDEVAVVSGAYGIDTVLSIFDNLGKGKLSLSKTIRGDKLDDSRSTWVTSLDLNGDSYIDIAATMGKDKITFLYNDGKGNFDEENMDVYDSGYGYPADLRAEDINGDGQKDLLYVLRYSDKLMVYLTCKKESTPTPTIMPAEGLCKSVVFDSLHSECLVSCKKTDANYVGMDKWGADYNCDGDVTGGDFIIWRREFLDKIVGDSLQSDGNCDNKVSLADYSKWREEYLK